MFRSWRFPLAGGGLLGCFAPFADLSEFRWLRSNGRGDRSLFYSLISGGCSQVFEDSAEGYREGILLPISLIPRFVSRRSNQFRFSPERGILCGIDFGELLLPLLFSGLPPGSLRRSLDILFQEK